MKHSALVERHAENVMARCDVIAAESSRRDGIDRFFLSEEHARVNAHLRRWMTKSRLKVWQDDFGSQWGRVDAGHTSGKALVIGSHVDTVPDAGRYDGVLGVLIGIAVAEMVADSGIRLDRPLEVVAFGDEEGSRFPATLMSSRFLAGLGDPGWLDLKDKDGISLESAMESFGLDPAVLRSAQHHRHLDGVGYYLEPHIEQADELERRGHAVGAVSGVAGAVRATVSLAGEAGHAGSRLESRRDAGAGAAEIMMAIESYARVTPDMRATVGRVSFGPGAVNVVPGRAELSIDLRATSDQRLHVVWDALMAEIGKICNERGLALSVRRDHAAGAVAFDGAVTTAVAQSIETGGAGTAPTLWSMPGHDAMVMAGLVDTGMVFIRSRGGVSHSPNESVSTHDVAQAVEVCMRTVVNLCCTRSLRRAS